MCRFVLYLGPPIRLSALIIEPTHSLIHQSFKSEERAEPLNGDGFGVAWYGPETGALPARFRSVTPAWSNANLKDIARAVESHCILAHVRAATRGHTAGEANCHPFRAGRWSLMHNGDLGGFSRLRRRLLSGLSDEAFRMIEGQTDSEHIFAVFLDQLRDVAGDPSILEIANAVRRTIEIVLGLASEYADGEDSHLNLAVTDGHRAVVTRFTTRARSEGESLYVNRGERYVCEEGVCRMLPSREGTAVLVCSEPLSEDAGWEAVPRNSIACIDRSGPVEVQPL